MASRTPAAVEIAVDSGPKGQGLSHRAWTGLPFDRTGEVIVPGVLVPAHFKAEHDHAVYVEPNVWVRHELS